MLCWLLIFLIAGGERLEYDIKYGPLTLGSMVLERLAPDTLDGVVCERLRARVEIDRALSMVFWANYDLASWCREGDMLTIRSYKHTREKNYQAEWWADYDHQRGVVRYSDGVQFSLPDSARDMLTLWFYLRSFKWRKGDQRVLNAHIDRRNWRLAFVATGQQTVRTEAGEFNCLVISPQAGTPLGAVFLTRDSRHIPVVIRTRVGALTVSAFLRKIKEGR